MPEQLDAIVIGTCVVTGCTPTKTMVASAPVAHLARRAADYGVRTGPIEMDMAVVRQRKRGIVQSWSSGSRKGMERHQARPAANPRARTCSWRPAGCRTATRSIRRRRAWSSRRAA